MAELPNVKADDALALRNATTMLFRRWNAMRISLSALIVAGVLAGTATLAVAAPPWSNPDPLPVPEGGDILFAPTIGAGQSGERLISYRFRRDLEGPLVPNAALATLPSRAQRTLATLAAPPAPYAQSRAAYLRLRPAPGGDRNAPRGDLGVSFGSTQGTVGSFRVLQRDVRISEIGITPNLGDYAIDANVRGQVAVAYVDRRDDRDYLRLALRAPGRDVAAPRVIVGRGGRISDIALAYGEGGDLVIAYQRAFREDGRLVRRIESRVQRAGHSLGDIQALGPSDGAVEVDAAMAPTGRTIVIWGEQDAGEEVSQPWTVRAAVRPAGPRSFRQATILDEGVPNLGHRGGVHVATAPDGTATVLWSSTAEIPGAFNSAWPVRSATTDASARFAEPQQLDDSGAASDVAVADDGTAYATWSAITQERDDQVLAAARTPGGPFAAAEAVSEPGGATESALTIDPTTGRPSSVWIANQRAFTATRGG